MSSSEHASRRRALALLACASLVSGCFRPMLAEDTAASGLRGRVALPPVGDRFSYHVFQALEKRLGEPAEPDFRLEVETALTERGLLVRQDNVVTRLQLTARSVYRLYREGVPEPVLVDEVLSEAGFDQTASLYASRTTRQDVEERIARDIGERIARNILARADRLTTTG